MMSDDDIPLLTDLIEEKVDITTPQLGLDVDQDMYIDEDDDLLPILQLETEEATSPEPQPAPGPLPINPALEQTIRRILDEHMELAWQEIRLAIQLAQEEDGSNR